MPLILAKFFVVAACVGWFRKSPSRGTVLMIAGMILSVLLLLPKFVASIFDDVAITPLSDAVLGVEQPTSYRHGEIYFMRSSFRLIAYLGFAEGAGLFVFALGLWMEARKLLGRFEAKRMIIQDEP
jgi:hypothetical protein